MRSKKIKVKTDFKSWLSRYKDVDRPIGDLAQDVLSDSNFPLLNVKDKKIGLNYLQYECGACSGAIEAYKNAFKLYISNQKGIQDDASKS